MLLMGTRPNRKGKTALGHILHIYFQTDLSPNQYGHSSISAKWFYVEYCLLKVESNFEKADLKICWVHGRLILICTATQIGSNNTKNRIC